MILLILIKVIIPSWLQFVFWFLILVGDLKYFRIEKAFLEKTCLKFHKFYKTTSKEFYIKLKFLICILLQFWIKMLKLHLIFKIYGQSLGMTTSQNHEKVENIDVNSK